MSDFFRGKLCGFPCSETSKPLANLTVRLWCGRDAQSVATLAAAKPKDTFAVLAEERIEERSCAWLAETQTDGEENFSWFKWFKWFKWIKALRVLGSQPSLTAPRATMAAPRDYA